MKPLRRAPLDISKKSLVVIYRTDLVGFYRLKIIPVMKFSNLGGGGVTRNIDIRTK